MALSTFTIGAFAQEPVPQKLIVPSPARSLTGTTINDIGGVFTLDSGSGDLLYHDGLVSTSAANVILPNFSLIGTTSFLNGYVNGIPLRAALLGETCTLHANVFTTGNVPNLLTVAPDGQIVMLSDLSQAPFTSSSNPSGGTWVEINLGAVTRASGRGSFDGLLYLAQLFLPDKVAQDVYSELTDPDYIPAGGYNTPNSTASEPVPGTPGGTGGQGRSEFTFNLDPYTDAIVETRGASNQTTGPFVGNYYFSQMGFTSTDPPVLTFDGPAIAGDKDSTLYELGSGTASTRQVLSFLELYPLSPGLNMAIAADRGVPSRQMLVLMSDAVDLREGPPPTGPGTGDYNSSGGIDPPDYLTWCAMVPVSALNKPVTGGNAAADLNGNGLTDLYDLRQILRRQAYELGPRGGDTSDPNFRNPSVGFIITTEFNAVPDTPGFNVDFFIACRGNGRGVGAVIVQCDPVGPGTAKPVALTFDQNGFSNVLERGQNLGDGVINVFIDNPLSIDRGVSEVNRFGQMAFTVGFNGGNNGIYRVQGIPVPEPAARVEAREWMLMD